MERTKEEAESFCVEKKSSDETRDVIAKPEVRLARVESKDLRMESSLEESGSRLDQIVSIKINEKEEAKSFSESVVVENKKIDEDPSRAAGQKSEFNVKAQMIWTIRETVCEARRRGNMFR